SASGQEPEPVYFPWQEGEAQGAGEELSEEQRQLRQFQRWGRGIVMFLFAVFSGGFVIAMFVSLYQAVHAPPKVWIPAKSSGENRRLISPWHLHMCLVRLQRLDREMEHESKQLWYRVRHGNRYYLTSWRDWSLDWQRRMKQLMEWCPFRAKDKISRGFRRASLRMLSLQKRQTEMFSAFFSKNQWLFREIREGLQILQEEVRTHRHVAKK
ncbi:MAG: hypothetical protein AAGJ35_07865, partial [Myxococcota bacterium]